jgi:hypothetical protein
MRVVPTRGEGRFNRSIRRRRQRGSGDKDRGRGARGAGRGEGGPVGERERGNESPELGDAAEEVGNGERPAMVNGGCGQRPARAEQCGASAGALSARCRATAAAGGQRVGGGTERALQAADGRGPGAQRRLQAAAVVASTRRRSAWHVRLLFRVREAALADEAPEQGQRGGQRGKQGMVRRRRLPAAGQGADAERRRRLPHGRL